MSVKYQALLGDTSIDADSIVVNELVAEKAIIGNLDVTKDLNVEGITRLNELILPTGAGDGKILTSDAVGSATWKDNMLIGDITGLASANVQHHKWIGNWDVLTSYQKYNRVTHNYVEYRALEDNLGLEPSVDPVWEIVMTYRPDAVFEEKAQPLRNKTDVDVVDLTVHNSAKFHVPQIGVFESVPRYLVGTGVNKDELKWAVNIDAPQVLVRNGFYYPNDGRAEAGKVLTCIGNTGLCDWLWPNQANVVTMGGDVTGPSNASVINTLAGGTIQVNELLTIHDVPTLPDDIVLEEKVQPLRNKTDADIVDLTVKGSLKLELPTINSGVFNIRYLVGWQEPNFNECRWVEDLHARAVGAHYQFLYPANGTAVAGKILRCVDSTGLAEWSDAPSITLGGDVTGSSGANVVNTLAGGTIAVNQIVLKESSDLLKNKNLIDPSNTVFANGLRVGATWSRGLGGSGPTMNDVLTYNGSFSGWAPATSILPNLAGDVTGTYGATSVKTLADGTISVYNLITSTGNQGMINKQMNDASNDISANRLRNGNLWNVQLASGAPANNSVLCYNGQYGIWALPSSLVTLAGDVTGAATNNVATKASGDFSVAGYLTPAKTIRMPTNKYKSIVWYDGGDVNNESDMRFSGLGNGGASIVYNLGTSQASHIFRVANSASTYQNLFSVIGTGYSKTDYPLNMGDAFEVKKMALYDVNAPSSKGYHNFSGFGTATNQLRYQLESNAWSHVFYAASGTGTSVELARINGGGDFSATRTISSSNGDRRKKIVVHEEGTTTDSNDHRFHGLGVQAFQMRYQISSTLNNHVFYAATSATVSNELFRIMGDGNAICAKKMVATTSQVVGWNDTTNQGAYIGWNKDNGSGRTTFANQMGGGYGGWNWINYSGGNVQTPSGDPAMTLDRDGNLTVRGNLTVNGNMGQDETITNGYWRSSNGTQKQTSVRLIKTGKLINLSVSAWDTTTPSSGYVQWTNISGVQLAIPEWARPSTTIVGAGINYHHPMSLTDQNYGRVSGTFEITYDGKLLISPNVGTTLINRAGWNPFSITYPTD